MGVEGRDKVKTLDTGAAALSNQLGKTVQRLRKAYNLSLSELSGQSGVAKSIISQIERNETNPTLATIWRLSQALDVSIERVLRAADDEPFLEKSSRGDTPILVSDDGKCRLAIIGWIKTVEWLQWYDFSADPGGVLEFGGASARLRGKPVGERRGARGRSGRRDRAGQGRRDFALSLRSSAYDPQRVAKTGLGDNGLHSEGGGDGIARLAGHARRATRIDKFMGNAVPCQRPRQWRPPLPSVGRRTRSRHT